MEPETTFFGLTGKKGLIIGGGQGMGESAARVPRARRLRRRAGRSGRGTGRACRPEGPRARRRSVTIIGDVLDDGQIPRIVAEAEAKLGGLDRMISIVGAATWGSLLETTGDDLGPADAAKPALLLPGRQGGRPVADPPRPGGRDRRHRLGGRPARQPDARRLRRREGRLDQPGANHGGRVGAASHQRQRHRAGPYRHAAACTTRRGGSRVTPTA